MRIARLLLAAAAVAAFLLLPSQASSQRPEDSFAALAKAYLALDHPANWAAIERLPGLKWAPQPTELKNCLPNGDCFASQGSGTVGGRNLTVVATGARTMVMHLLVRNTSAPFGGPAVVAALTKAGMTAELVRCPVKSDGGGTNWYRLKRAGVTTGHLSIQPAAPGRQGEGYILSAGDELPALPPNQLASYTESCAEGAERKPVSTSKPHELIAEQVVSLLVPAGGAPFYDWKTLTSGASGVTWNGTEPKKWDLSSKGNSDPVALSGSVAYAGRKFSVLASGTPAQVKTIYLEEEARHPSGEHMLGVVYEKGIAVKLVRCGPVYTESTNNWYSLTSTKTKPAMLRQSISYDGKMVADTYELRLDGSLPARDPRDRNPGTGGC